MAVSIRKPAPDGRTMTCTFPLVDEEVLIYDASPEELMAEDSVFKHVKEFGYLVEATELTVSDAPRKLEFGAKKERVFGVYTEEQFQELLEKKKPGKK